MPDKYQDLREALKNSTPGEWAAGPAYADDEGYTELPLFSLHEGKQLAPMAIALQFPYVRGMQEANAALAVLAHNLMPDLLAKRDALREALSVICEWQPPEVLSRGEVVPMAVAIGSNGERDYFRGIARAALSQ